MQLLERLYDDHDQPVAGKLGSLDDFGIDGDREGLLERDVREHPREQRRKNPLHLRS